MKLKDAFYCSECQEIFDYAEYRTVCPGCANRFGFSLQRFLLPSPKEVQNENIEIDRVYVTPVRYDVCRAGTDKDGHTYCTEIKSNVSKITVYWNKFRRDSSICGFSIAAVRSFTEFFNSINVYGKHRKSKSHIQSRIQRFNANTLASILSRR